jgi:hypothetical protein
MHRPAALR